MSTAARRLQRELAEAEERGAEISEHRVRRSLSSRVTGGFALMPNPMVGGLARTQANSAGYLRGHRSNDLRGLGNPIPGSCRNPHGGLLR